MDEDRRDTTNPGRRYTDAATRELVRALLEREGYMTQEHGDLRYVRQDSVRGRLDNRRANAALWIAITGLFAGPFLTALAQYLFR